MADPLSDDSSAASSTDEILNMVCPFSQGSAVTTSPEKSGGKGSDSEDDDASWRKEGKHAGKYPGKKRKHQALDEGSSIRATEQVVVERKARANARNAFHMAFHGTKIGVPDKLCWHERTKKGKKVIFPVRIVMSPEEIVGLALKNLNNETHFPIHNLGIKNSEGEYDTASKKSLSPYYGKDGQREHWCPVKLERYLKQLKKSKRLETIDLETEKSFLRCVLEKSLEEGEQEKKLSQVDEAVPEEISAFARQDDNILHFDSEEEENEDDARGSRRSCRRSTGMQRTEKLRPGDRIAYYPQQCVAGDPKDLLEATVLYIDPTGERILTIDDAYTSLQPDHMVKRIQRKQGSKLVDNDGAQFRPINKYILRKEGDPDALNKLLKRGAAEGKKAIQNLKEMAIAKMEKDGSSAFKDMLR